MQPCESAMDRYNEMLKEQPEIFQRVPLAYIASYLGITPESLKPNQKAEVALLGTGQTQLKI